MISRAVEFAETWTGSGEGYISSLALSPDDTKLAVCYADGPVRIVATSGEVLVEVNADSAGALCAAWHPSSTRFVTGNQDGGADVWDTDGRLLFNVETGAAWTERVAF